MAALTFLIVLLTAVSTVGAPCCTVWNPNPPALPGSDPYALWRYLTKLNSYKNWSFWWDHKGLQPGQTPHGALHKIYINRKARTSYKAPAQYDAIIVEENYTQAKELESITVMYKIKDYNPKGGDWFWVKYLPYGWPEVHGKPDNCINCHRKMESNDFIIVHELREPPEELKEWRKFIHEVQ